MIIGVSGKIASGKTTVLEILKKQDFLVIFADEVVNDLYGPGAEGAKMIAKVFGKQFLLKNGRVDRKNLRQFVFNDPQQLGILIEKIHPLVIMEIRKQLYSIEGDVIIEAVYFDNELGHLVDKMVWVERPKLKTLEVLVSERGFSRKLAEQVYQLVKKPKKVDFVLKNDGKLVDLKNKINNVLLPQILSS